MMGSVTQPILHPLLWCQGPCHSPSQSLKRWHKSSKDKTTLNIINKAYYVSPDLNVDRWRHAETKQA